ncbi:MAG: hypothetical protein QXO51_01440 [Halobacteria archaeon]
MEEVPQPRVCMGPAGFALGVTGLLLIVLLGTALLSPETAVVLFMAIPALLAVTILRKARERMRMKARPPGPGT